VPARQDNMLRGGYHFYGNGDPDMPPPPDTMLARYGNNNGPNDPGRGPIRQNRNGAADQIDPQTIADIAGLAYHRFNLGQQDELCQLLQDIIDAHNATGGEAADQFEPGGARSSRLPSLMGAASNRGTSSRFEQRDDWNESAIDRGRNGRNASDRRRPAQDAALRSARAERQAGGFFARFPDAARINIGGRY